MNIIVRSEVMNNKVHPANQDDEILYINKAHKTAECANKYAHELHAEFTQLLMPAITRTDVKVAGRFTSLLNELCFMTTRAFEASGFMCRHPDVKVHGEVWERGDITKEYHFAHQRCVRRLRRILARKRDMQKWCEKWDAMHDRFVKEVDALQASKPEGIR